MSSFGTTSIGTVRNDRTDVQYTDNWGAVRRTITVDERFDDACLQGLEGFSHVEVLFVFRARRPCSAVTRTGHVHVTSEEGRI